MSGIRGDRLPFWVLAFLCFVLIAVGGVNRLNGNLPQNTFDTLK